MIDAHHLHWPNVAANVPKGRSTPCKWADAGSSVGQLSSASAGAFRGGGRWEGDKEEAKQGGQRAGSPRARWPRDRGGVRFLNLCQIQLPVPGLRDPGLVFCSLLGLELAI